MFAFWKIWRALFSWNTRFEIRPFVSLSTYSELIIHIFQNLEIKNLHHQFLHCYNSTKIDQHIFLVRCLVGLLFYFSNYIKFIPQWYFTVEVSTVTNTSSSYNVTSVANVKVCNSFASCESVFEVDPIHFDVAHAITNWFVKHVNVISWSRPRIPPVFITHAANVNANVNNFREVDCPHVLFHLMFAPLQIQTP